ncbi:MAG TPA: DMT family transporter [Candidatus Dormibacteraeota bacterium]|nr:DMT family transporter [Candidatus Dormibacteraeota bacterium]
MKGGDAVRLLILAALLGASFLFIRVSVIEVPPLGVVEARLALGAVAIALYALVRGQRSALAGLRRPAAAAVGMVSAGLPYLCFAWGETRVASGVAAICNSAAPLFSALLAQALPNRPQSERLTPARATGLAVGLGGVVALVAVSGLGGEVDLLGLGVLLCAPVLYAIGAFLARRTFAGESPLVPAVSANGLAALLILPFALAAGRPAHGVSIQATLSLVALGVGGTGIAYVLYYRLLESLGATGALTVTYLLPGFALFYGAVFLGEPVRPVAVLALALILAGTALTNGVRLRRRPPVVPGQAEPAISDQRS